MIKSKIKDLSQSWEIFFFLSGTLGQYAKCDPVLGKMPLLILA